MNVRRMVSGVVLTGLLVAGSACDGGAAGRPGPAATGQGSPAAAAGHGSHTPAPESPPLRDGERFVTLSLPRAYTPAAPNGGTDEYRCFLVDPGLTGNAFLTGSRFLPQNAAVVHHAIFFRVMPAQVQIARQVDADSAGEGWTCFGDAGIPGDAAWVAHWAPGVGETGLAADLGYPMPAGSRLIMQVHYNLLGVPR
ncbi:MAG TPA: monooxygenase, partial [Actinoplanes sp.]|nr:monooxygenase [Actinoplanes sp.]